MLTLNPVVIIFRSDQPRLDIDKNNKKIIDVRKSRFALPHVNPLTGWRHFFSIGDLYLNGNK